MFGRFFACLSSKFAQLHFLTFGQLPHTPSQWRQ
jgi:hypothetical protein